MAAVLRTPQPETPANVKTFAVGETDILRVEERRTSPVVEYLVQFKDATPTAESVEASIDVLRIFADITWDFHLLCDMRAARLMSQLSHSTSYYRLVKLIRNEHCKHCFVYLSPLMPVVGSMLTTTVSTIVAALGVDCTLVEMEAPAGAEEDDVELEDSDFEED